MAQSLQTLIGKTSGGSTEEGPTDNREFKNFQDFYGVVERNDSEMPSNTRDCGNADGGTGTGAQERKVTYNSTVNWVVPTGVSKIRVTILGAGGGGASRRGSHYHGGGGGQGAAFVSGEVNVTAGQTLDIQVGRGGQGSDSTSQGGNGSSSSVAMSSGDGGTSVLSLISPGGYGGYEQGGLPPNPSTGTLSGSALLSPYQYNNAGGQSGKGSNRSFGFGPEGYGAGGGGSAGSYKGTGYRGGNGENSAGYSFTSGGGGGIGGDGGDAGSNNGASQGWSHAGGGGGSRSQGNNGANSNSGVQSHGGQGWTDQLTGFGFTPHEEQSQELATAPARPDEYYRGYDPTNSSLNSAWNSWDWWKIMKGTRFGDGVSGTVQASRLSGGGGASFEGGMAGGGSGSGVTAAGGATYGPKMFNGVLGRLVGSGGAGTSTENHNFGHQSFQGGEGGSGGGGGGAASSQTNSQTSNRDWYSFFEWDPTNMAFTYSINGATFGAQYDGRGEQNLAVNTFRLQGVGGCGGACGGGGGSGSTSIAGMGGIGAGGGGGNGHFNTTYGGRGGEGGPGYVLIEW